MSIEKALGKLRAAQMCHSNAVQALIDEAITAIQQPATAITNSTWMQASAPAPWEASFHKTVTGKPFGIVTGGQPGNGRMDIVICYGPDAYDEPLSFKAFLANAPLIAAAPKLLAALELIANAENSALDLAYCKGVARAAIGASATTSR